MLPGPFALPFAREEKQCVLSELRAAPQTRGPKSYVYEVRDWRSFGIPECSNRGTWSSRMSLHFVAGNLVN